MHGYKWPINCTRTRTGPDSTRQPRATYQVYAAYGNTSGVMVPVSRHCDFADAFASYVRGGNFTLLASP